MFMISFYIRTCTQRSQIATIAAATCLLTTVRIRTRIRTSTYSYTTQPTHSRLGRALQHLRGLPCQRLALTGIYHHHHHYTIPSASLQYFLSFFRPKCSLTVARFLPCHPLPPFSPCTAMPCSSATAYTVYILYQWLDAGLVGWLAE